MSYLELRAFLEVYPHPSFIIHNTAAASHDEDTAGNLHPPQESIERQLLDLDLDRDLDLRDNLRDNSFKNDLTASWSNTAWKREGCLDPGTVRTLTHWLASPGAGSLDLSLAHQRRYRLVKTEFGADAVVISVPCQAGEGTSHREQDQGPTTSPKATTTQNKNKDKPSPRPLPPPAPLSPLSPPPTPARTPPALPFDPPVRPPGAPQPRDLGLSAETREAPTVCVGADGRPKPVRTLSTRRGHDVRALLDTTDWGAVPLFTGIQSFVQATMSSPNMCALWVGRAFTCVYNQHFADVLAPRHPAAFGCSGAEGWGMLEDMIGAWSEVLLAGQGLHMQDKLVLVKESTGKHSEVYTNQHWVPVRDPSGEFLGIFVSCVDTTAKVVSERRGEILRRLTEHASRARTMGDFDSGVLRILEEKPREAPFAALYRVERVSGSGASRTRPPTPRGDALDARVLLTCAGGVGVPEDHPSLPLSVALSLQNTTGAKGRPKSNSGSSSHGDGDGDGDGDAPMADDAADGDATHTRDPDTQVYHNAKSLGDPDASSHGRSHTISFISAPTDHRWPFVEALTSHRAVLVRDCRSLIEGYVPRAGDALPTSAVVIPITRDSDEGIPGALLVLGINAALPFDSTYATFIDLLRLQLASFLVAVRSYVQDQELIQQLAEVDHAKNLLFANVANDLLAPISLIAGPLDDLVDDVEASPTGAVLLNIARRNVRSLRAMVRMLVEVSALSRGAGVMTFTRVNLGALSRDMASMFRRGIEKQGVEYKIDCDLTPHEVYVDREAWEKVVVTTIGMSAKYTRCGFIHFCVRYSGGQAIVQFRNSSTGLPGRLVERIGELDYQTTRDDNPAGAVIHFALLKKLIDMHGGTLAVESTAVTDSVSDSGVSVTICLPLGSGHLPQEDIQVGPEVPMHDLHLWEDWKDSALESPSTIEPRSWGVDPATLYFEPTDVIVLVDDSPDSLRYMRAIFEPFCTVLEARSAREALEICAERTPDLVVANLMLPYENGNVLLAALRAHAAREMQMVPLIMLTPHDDWRPVHALAADDYLARPFNARELLSRGHMQLQLGKRRRDLEARFEERTAELRALMDESPMGIIRCNSQDVLTYANAAWHKQSGYPLDGDLSDWIAYLSEESYDHITSKWLEFVADPEAHTLTVNGQWLTGTWTAVKTIKMFKNDGETLVGFLGSCMDISEHKLNEKLQNERTLLAEQRRREAEEAKQQQELLIDITSHEIRNPISSLMQCSSLVKTNLLGLQEDLGAVIASGDAYHPTPQLLHTIQEDLDALDSIYECALTQERISNDVLSLGKIQLDLLQMFDVATDISAEAHKILSVFQNEARMNRVQMSLTFSNAFDELGVANVKLDPVRFGQVVTNLLANAIRFVSASDERRVELRLDIGTVPPHAGSCTKPPDKPDSQSQSISPDKPLYLYTEVVDTGPGLRPAELQTLFQRFTQASAKTHTVFGGSGLGLFVCRKITELMGGRIEVASEYGRGSVFRFFVQTRPCAAVVSRKRPTLARAVDTARRILVVEDNVINRTVLQRQLKHVGLQSESARNGLKAVERLRETGPGGFDCVLMDLEMPVMDGYTATRLLREAEGEGGAGYAIIALTGNARQAQIDDKMRDFDEVVVKPYRLDDLLCKIENVIKRRAAGIPLATIERNGKCQ